MWLPIHYVTIKCIDIALGNWYANKRAGNRTICPHLLHSNEYEYLMLNLMMKRERMVYHDNSEVIRSLKIVFSNISYRASLSLSVVNKLCQM